MSMFSRDGYTRIVLLEVIVEVDSKTPPREGIEALRPSSPELEIEIAKLIQKFTGETHVAVEVASQFKRIDGIDYGTDEEWKKKAKELAPKVLVGVDKQTAEELSRAVKVLTNKA